jgi:hypothetical protein
MIRSISLLPLGVDPTLKETDNVCKRFTNVNSKIIINIFYTKYFSWKDFISLESMISLPRIKIWLNIEQKEEPLGQTCPEAYALQTRMS